MSCQNDFQLLRRSWQPLGCRLAELHVLSTRSVHLLPCLREGDLASEVYSGNMGAGNTQLAE